MKLQFCIVIVLLMYAQAILLYTYPEHLVKIFEGPD